MKKIIFLISLYLSLTSIIYTSEAVQSSINTEKIATEKAQSNIDAKKNPTEEVQSNINAEKVATAPTTDIAKRTFDLSEKIITTAFYVFIILHGKDAMHYFLRNYYATPLYIRSKTYGKYGILPQFVYKEVGFFEATLYALSLKNTKYNEVLLRRFDRWTTLKDC